MHCRSRCALCALESPVPEVLNENSAACGWLLGLGSGAPPDMSIDATERLSHAPGSRQSPRLMNLHPRPPSSPAQTATESALLMALTSRSLADSTDATSRRFTIGVQYTPAETVCSECSE
jgi:hypothetical protein